MFYYEQKNIFGRWQPCVSDDAPLAKTEAGTRQTIRNVTRVPEDMQAFDLDSLQHFLGTKEYAA